MFLYILTQFINVTLGTIKSIVTVKGRALVATLVTTLSCTISAVVVKCVSNQPFGIIVIITLLTNLIGVPIGTWIANKTQKEKLWVYNATIKCNESNIITVKHLLSEQGVHSIYEEIVPDEMYELRVFSSHKTEGKLIRTILKAWNAKYYIIEPK